MKKSKFVLLTLLVCFCFSSAKSFALPMDPTPGEKTLKNFLLTALKPVGRTMYIWGGAWNSKDEKTEIGSVTIGLKPEWKDFYLKQNENYNFKDYSLIDKNGKELPNPNSIDLGCDCSGFVGWVIYNLLNTESGLESYVMKSTKMASEFADKGWGKFIEAPDIKKHYAGDIMSTNGHVYICLGEFEDGSVLLVHSSPPGVQINGTTTIDGKKDSLAIQFAEKYMQTYYKGWCKKYPKLWRDESYLTNFNQMKWYVKGESGSILSDPDDIRHMDVRDVLQLLFDE